MENKTTPGFKKFNPAVDNGANQTLPMHTAMTPAVGTGNGGGKYASGKKPKSASK